MVKHIILWTLKDEYTEAQKKEIRAGIKKGLEGLKRADSGNDRHFSAHRLSSDIYRRCDA